MIEHLRPGASAVNARVALFDFDGTISVIRSGWMEIMIPMMVEILMALKTDIGVGIRVGLPRTPKNLLRIDFAYALNRDPLGRRGFIVSFSSGQAF